MTRAEKAAMEAYPPKFVTPKRGAKRIQSEKVDTHAPTRAIYRKGYERAEKEIKDTLLEWLENKIKIPDVSFINGLTYLAYKDVIEHINEL